LVVFFGTYKVPAAVAILRLVLADWLVSYAVSAAAYQKDYGDHADPGEKYN
jgi:hypothetical protein